MNIEKLQEYRSASGLTYEQISDSTGISARTVSAIFTNPGYNPTLDTILPVVALIGGSLDEVCDLEMPPPNILPPAGTADHDLIRQTFKSHNQTIAAYGQYTKHLKRQLLIHQITNGVLIAFILFFVVYDVTHPNIGFVQYTVSALTQTWSAIKDSFAVTLQALEDRVI